MHGKEGNAPGLECVVKVCPEIVRWLEDSIVIPDYPCDLSSNSNSHDSAFITMLRSI